MQGRIARLAAACLALCLLVGGLAAAPGTSGAVRPRPNVVVIQTDDQTLNQLTATWVTATGTVARVMPQTIDRIRRRGINFTRYYASYPLCCPSRATLISGRYAHSNGVISNDAPRGGWPGYRRKAIFNHNLGVWLQRAGYRTIHLGKFLNNYGGATKADPTTEVPPGWDEWQTFASDNSSRLFYGYQLNVDGTLTGPLGDPEYDRTSGKDDPGCPANPPLLGSCNYSGDVLTQRAVDQIAASAPGRPFYLQLDYNAPHGDPRPPIGPEPAARHYDTAVNTPLPKKRDFNEGNITDKPSFIRDAALRLDGTATRRIKVEYQKSLESLRSVDEGVGRVIDALKAVGELGRTYVFFISDNGFFFGEHRLERAKFLPYEPAIHMPLLVRGPGIKPNSRTGELVANIDIAPTILQLTGARATKRFDGRSLVPFWKDRSRRTRRPILLESFAKATDLDGDGIPDGRRPRRGAGASIAAPLENYLGVRLGPYKYVEYETGDRELYNLANDPLELNSRHEDRRYDRLQRFLRIQLKRLEGCVGRECKFTTTPLPKPGKPVNP